MKKLILLLIGVIAISVLLFSQVNEGKNYLYLFSDSIVYGKISADENSFLGTTQFSVDSRKMEPNIVKFYKDESGFFANTINLNAQGSSRFTERIRQGRINLYGKERRNYKSILYNLLVGANTRNIISTNSKYYYYNKKFDNLEKVNYKNLSIDLADNPESMIHLTKYKSITHTQTMLYIVAVPSLIIGLVGIAESFRSGPKPNPTLTVVGLVVGTGCIWTNYFLSLSKRKLLKTAIGIYNNS